MDEAAAAVVLEEEEGENVLRQDDGASMNNEASVQNHDEMKTCTVEGADSDQKSTHWESFTSHLDHHVLDEEAEEDQTANASLADEMNEEITGVDTVEDVSGSDTTASSQKNGSEFGWTETDNSRKVYACHLCGKIYMYQVSFKKHQQMHEYEKKQKVPKPGSSGLKGYKCPDCGSTFIRQARLISHLKLHKMQKSDRRCDQCNKTFASATSWIGHIRLHKLRPFWCFTCARGFTDQWIFRKHMHLHNRKHHTCNICQKSFMFLRQLNNHYNLHTGAKPYICSFCGKAVSNPATLHAHRKKHLKVLSGSSALKGLKSVGFEPLDLDWNKVMVERVMHHNNEQPKQTETNGNLQWQSEKSEDEITPLNACDNGQSGNQENVKPEYKLWECCECDMCFNEVTQLHSHYMQHATGEIPLSWDQTVS